MLSRRTFLNTSLGAGLALAAPGVAAAQTPQAGRRRIVDAQVHLWKANTPDRPWPPNTVPQLPEPFSYEKLVPMMDEAGVERVVIVPPSWEGDRIDYALEARSKYPTRFGIMGRIPLADPKSAELLPKWKEQPGMLGIRVSFNGPGQVAWLANGTADWFWPAAEKAGIPVMFLSPANMAPFAAIAEKHPQLRLIIDHMGLSIDIAKAGKREEAVAQAAALAKYSNVSVKLSSAPTYSFDPYPYRDMTPFIRRLYDAFGPQRCHWGTDMTNSFATATYRQRITHFTEELQFLSEDDKDWIMGRAIMARLNWA
jgi:predicted TIM-barrel fold metal-dependent hydrolase